MLMALPSLTSPGTDLMTPYPVEVEVAMIATGDTARQRGVERAILGLEQIARVPV